ncbi:MAG: tetratricopeptide repeat protein [Chitinispirillaceae bacterium]|nr:tetratricopeptide repeat protein [Chitinispirillaceae bacterium]
MMMSRGCLCTIALVTFSLAVEFNFDLEQIENEALTARVMKAAVEAEAWNRKGLDALDRNDLAGALDCFDAALKIVPEYSDAINNRGVVKFRKGEIGSAREIWEKLASRDPGYAIASYNLSLVYLHEGRNDAAQRLLERALGANKQLIEAQVRLGTVFLKKGERRKALDQLKKAYKNAPTHPDAWSFYSYALIENGDTTEALAVLKKYSDKPEALKLLGRIEASRRNHGTAKNYLSQAVSKGADPEVLVELANTQVESRNCKEAQQTLTAYFSRAISPSADAFLLAGIAAKECDDSKAAQDYFERGSTRYPNDGILRYNLGQVYFLRKNFDKAETTWKSLSDTLQDPSLLYLRALNAHRRNELSAAEQLITKALELDDRAEYHDFLGVVYYRKGNGKKAEEAFKRAIKINPELRSAQLNLALCTKSPGELSGAVRLLEKILSNCIGESCGETALQLSALYYYQKETAKAIATLAAVKDADRDERIYRNLALYYREQHDWENAITTLEAAVSKLVTEPQTDYDLAETYLLAGRHHKAIERFTLLIPKWHQNPWRLYYQLGYAYMEINDLAKAKECFEKSLNRKKDNVASRGLLAYVFNSEGNVAKARELWQKNLADDPSNASLWVNMGLSYERDGKYEEALQYYRKAVDLKSDDPQIQINIGNVYTAVAQYTDALTAYKMALHSPKRETAQYNIFLLYARKRDKEQAQKTLLQLEQDFSSSASTRRAQSEMALWNKDTTKAITLLEGLSEKEGGDWITLAQIYAFSGRKNKAEECLAKVPNEAQWDRDKAGVRAALAFSSGNYQEVIHLVRKSGDTGLAARYNLALAYYHMRQYADALSTAESLVKKASGSDRADLCRLAGNAAFGLKQWKNALQWYLQLSNVEAGSAVVQYNLAVASYNLGDVENAWKYYQRARELDPKIQNADIEKRYAAEKRRGEGKPDVNEADSLYNRAVDLQTTGDDSAALGLYLHIVAKDPLYNLAWNNLGAIYGKWGEIEKCEQAYQKAVEKKHDIPETYANLVNLYIELEEFSKARKWLVKGQGHNPESEILKDLRKKIVDAEARKVSR